MKIGFSSLVCPGWDLETLVAKACEHGFAGVELRGLRGDLRLTEIPQLAGNPPATRQLFSGSGVELVCLGTSCTLDSADRRALARNRDELLSYIELASNLRCPYVRMFMGERGRGDSRESVLMRVVNELAKIAPTASRHRVTILLENSGDFLGSADVWYVCDALSQPSIRACWNPCTARAVFERPTVSIPRLGHKIGMVHVCDATFDETGFLKKYELPGEGQVGWQRAIELLRGVVFQGYLMFEWPKLWDASLPDPDAALPQVAAFLTGCIDAKQAVLTAYKGDKHAPKFGPIPPGAPARGG